MKNLILLFLIILISSCSKTYQPNNFIINSVEAIDSIWNGYFGLTLSKYDNEHFQLLIKQLHDNLETVV